MIPNKTRGSSDGGLHRGRDRPNAAEDPIERMPREELVAMLRGLPETVFRVENDEKGRPCWTFYEGKLAEDLGLSTQDLYGKTIYEAPARLPDDLEDRIQQALQEGPQEGVDESEGRFFRHYIHASKETGGRAGAVYGCVMEVTDQVKAEHAQQELYEDLVDRNQMLDRVSRHTEQLNYTLSHDLRNPLTVILSLCEVLERELRAGKGDPVERVHKIRQAANRMNELLTDILKLSRSERAAPERKQVDVSLMAHEIMRQLTSSQPQRHMKYKVRPGIKVYADPNLLRDLLENLLSNAWKYTSKEDEPWIEVVEKEKDGKRWVCVVDNGIGFTREERDELFIPFRRLEAAQAFHGTGVGLATAKRIVERHGGQIDARGRPDEGAEFCFSLPDAESAPAIPEREAEPDAPTDW